MSFDLPRFIIEMFQIRRFNKLLIISFCLIFILVYFHKKLKTNDLQVKFYSDYIFNAQRFI